jgi:hypothetical protein
MSTNNNNNSLDCQMIQEEVARSNLSVELGASIVKESPLSGLLSTVSDLNPVKFLWKVLCKFAPMMEKFKQSDLSQWFLTLLKKLPIPDAMKLNSAVGVLKKVLIAVTGPVGKVTEAGFAMAMDLVSFLPEGLSLGSITNLVLPLLSMLAII